MDFQAFEFLRRPQCIGNRCHWQDSADLSTYECTSTQAVASSLHFESRNITLATIIIQCHHRYLVKA